MCANQECVLTQNLVIVLTRVLNNTKQVVLYLLSVPVDIVYMS